MKLADHIADGTRGFLMFGDGGKTELTHRIDDATLHRFETVTDRRQRPIKNYVHRVFEIGFLGKLAQR